MQAIVSASNARKIEKSSSTMDNDPRIASQLPVCCAVSPYGRLPLLDQLRTLVADKAAAGSELLTMHSQIYSYFDLNLEGCLSPSDYSGLKPLIDAKRLHLTFLWGCVENCVLLIQPPSEQVELLPSPAEWPVVWLDNENGIGPYALNFRGAVIKLTQEFLEEAVATDPEGAHQVAFVREVQKIAGLETNNPPVGAFASANPECASILELLRKQLDEHGNDPWV
eukprot:TRINITY_DN52361_c0_g1_i1.p1 TRINITY_DN52361_c0_g1~~TRINITY_DN52361_c0_g1_i1.p1  ORF type:complete len:224 (-),score=21.37 TRINITY_DN52361_c0_g1_i1:324-995(-)